jgi:CubicO group peptidase (beta-lactamase class C family)
MKKIVICIILVVVAIGIGIFFGYNAYRINKVTKMTFEEMLLYTTGNNEKALIAVGIIKNGESNYVFYGENGTTLPQARHIYEIGSITKTFTASLLYRAIGEGKVNIDDSIDKYLNLPIKKYYPTLRRVLTHTSGYKNYYLDMQIISNYFGGRNPYYRIPGKKLIEQIGKINLEDRDYDYKYSNFGISVIGAVLSEVYKKEYTKLINDYIREEFGLINTMIFDSSADLENYWDWAENDAYMPAGALTSTIEDMLKYAKMQMKEVPEYLSGTHEVLAQINANTSINSKMEIHMDSIGATWIIDSENNIIWHNGGTGNYNSYLGFDKDRQIAVVILSNLSPNYRIPATVMGVKLLKELQEKSNLEP